MYILPSPGFSSQSKMPGMGPGLRCSGHLHSYASGVQGLAGSCASDAEAAKKPIHGMRNPPGPARTADRETSLSHDCRLTRVILRVDKPQLL